MKKKLYIQPQSEVTPIYSGEGFLVDSPNVGGDINGNDPIDQGDQGGEGDGGADANNSVIWDH